MLRLKLGVDAPTGSTLDRPPFFTCHLVPKTGTLLRREQAVCSTRAKEGAGVRMTLPYQGPACCDAKTAWRSTRCSCLLQGGPALARFRGAEAAGQLLRAARHSCVLRDRTRTADLAMQRPVTAGVFPLARPQLLTSAGRCEEVRSCMFAFVRCWPGERRRLTPIGHDGRGPWRPGALSTTFVPPTTQIASLSGAMQTRPQSDQTLQGPLNRLGFLERISTNGALREGCRRKSMGLIAAGPYGCSLPRSPSTAQGAGACKVQQR
jgi:hypothetical protein